MPGVEHRVTCNVVADGVAGGTNATGQGTATFTTAARVVASALYDWSIATPVPTGGGGGTLCNRTTCVA